MALRRSSLAPCTACGVGENGAKAGPCCDQSCLDTIARRECDTQCDGNESSRGSSDNELVTAGEPDSSPLSMQTLRRKRNACSRHSHIVRERYLATLIKLGCICKDLIARNLEPCCMEAPRTSTQRATVDELDATEKSSEKMGSAVGTKVRFRSTERKINCGDTTRKRCCTGNSKVIYSSPMEETAWTATTNSNGIVAGENPNDYVVGTNNCKDSENKDDGCLSEEKDSSSENKKQNCCPSVKEECHSGCKQDKCCGSKDKESSVCSKKEVCTSKSRDKAYSSTAKEDNYSYHRGGKCCSSDRNDVSAALGKGYAGWETPKVAVCSSKSCCTTTDEGTPSLEVPDTFVCGSGASESDNCLKDTHAVKSHSGSVKFGNTDDRAQDSDIEKGTTSLEHVILNVQGLTCVGCETKLFRSLHNISGICNLRTSLVLSQAEFDLNQQASSVIEVIKSVETTTGFTCHRLNEGQEIDVIVDGNAKAFVDRNYPDGVTQMIVSDKQIVRITYDPKIVGARALLENSFTSLVKLADPRGSSELESGKKHVRNSAYVTLLSTALTIPVLILAWTPLPPRPIVYGSVSLALATIVQFAIAGPFYPSTLRALVFTHVIEMDLLIVLSTSTAYIFSLVSFAYQVVERPLPIGEFFETSTLLITLIMLGRWVSAFARQRAIESVSVRSLQAETAVLCDTDGRGDKQIDARLLQYGDLFKVMSDSRITTDGIVVMGTTEVDESMITGESLPVAKFPDSSVIGGSLNGSGVIIVSLTRLPGDNTISTIAAMVDEAKFSKAKTQELVDIVATYFVPIILALTIITFAIWIAIGISVRNQNGGRAVVSAITYAISVLIVSCPCAIGLAVPMVIVISGGVAAKHGIVFTSATVVESARKVSHVVFDKTGTLTQGEMSVMEAVHLTKNRDVALSIALGLTCSSKHPVSVAISNHLGKKGVNAAKISYFKSVTGKGIEGTFNGASVRCGNARWLSAELYPEVQDLLAQDLTVFCVAIDNRLVVAFGLSDSVRPEAHVVFTELQKRGITISIVSGDDAGAIESVADKLGIQTDRVRSGCSPGDKQQYVKDLMIDKQKIVIFCGDGTNDALALAQADIGVHMNSGSDVARTAADVVLMRPYLGGILVLLDLSKVAFHRIILNFVWSIVYNLFAISLASGAFVNARIPPQYAGLGEIVSVLPIILIALQLRWFKRDY